VWRLKFKEVQKVRGEPGRLDVGTSKNRDDGESNLVIEQSIGAADSKRSKSACWSASALSLEIALSTAASMTPNG